MLNHYVSIIFIILISIIGHTQSYNLYTSLDPKNLSQIVIKNNIVVDSWKCKSLSRKCENLIRAFDLNSSTIRYFQMNDLIEPNSFYPKVVLYDPQSPCIPYATPPIFEKFNWTFQLNYNCTSNLISNGNEKNWVEITLRLVFFQFESVDIQIIKYIGIPPNRKDFSIIIVLIVAILITSLIIRQRKLGIYSETTQEVPETSITIQFVIIYVILGSLSLLFLFFFFEYAIFLVTFALCISLFITLILILGQLLMKIFKSEWLNQTILFDFKRSEIIVSPISFLIILIWLYTKNWLISDFLAIFLGYIFIKFVKIPNFFIGSVLLTAFFFYDIFWVFLSEPIFGSNVMASVAVKIDLPVVIMIPNFISNAFNSCPMIGLGDILLPGLVMNYMYRFGESRKTNSYYITSVISYSLGLSVALIVLVIFNYPQPALLYLSPSIIIPGIVLSRFRKECQSFYKGVGIDEEIRYASNSNSRRQKENIKEEKHIELPNTSMSSGREENLQNE